MFLPGFKHGVCVCVQLVQFGNHVVRHKGHRTVKLFFGSPDLSDGP